MNDPDIRDDEPLYRRIPIKKNWYNPEVHILDAEAFIPIKYDTDGLSISRGKTAQHPDFLTPKQVSTVGPSPHGYFVVEISVGSLRELNIEIEPDPTPVDPGHCLLPEFKYVKPRPIEIHNLAERIVCEKVIRVHGPFIPEVKAESEQ